MGCFFSSEDKPEKCSQCHRKAVNNLSIENNICEICFIRLRGHGKKEDGLREVQTEPRFGKYHCSCGSYWTSRCAWGQSFQICKRCRRQVFPKALRKLRPDDFTASGRDDDKDHKKELCQRCQQLGRHCGTYRNNNGYRKNHKNIF